MKMEEIFPEAIQYQGDFVAGEWRKPKDAVSGAWRNHSPANFEWQLPELSYFRDHVETAIEAAAQAQKTWKFLSLEERCSQVKRFGEELAKRKELIGRCIAFESGKPLDESLGEAGLLSSKIDVTIEHGLELVKSNRVEIDDKHYGEIHWRPKGVMAVIGPFNFPVHLSHGHIVPALLMGNTVILKPSERTPYSAQLYMDAAKASGLPAGVLQMLQGPADIATRLLRGVDVDGVVATCSYEVGTKIQKSLAERPQKIIALEMGGKNAAIVWESTDVEFLANELIKSAYLSTGQRCTALSRVYVQRAVLSDLAQVFHEKAKELYISHPFDNNPKPFMGPLISEQAKEKFLRYHTIAHNEGAQTVMRPKALVGKTRLRDEPLPEGNYVSPGIHIVEKWDKKSSYQNHEIFGPDMFFCPIDSLDEGIEAVNSSQYGLVSSVFSNKKSFEYAADRIDAGLIYFNRATVGASGRLPFGGWKRSGNHRPAGLFAIYACTQAQARMI